MFVVIPALKVLIYYSKIKKYKKPKNRKDFLMFSFTDAPSSMLYIIKNDVNFMEDKKALFKKNHFSNLVDEPIINFLKKTIKQKKIFPK